MGLTVREALQMDCLARAQLVAGDRGLEREITFVNIMEVPEVVRWMKGGELLLTSGFALKGEDAAFRRELIRSLVRKEVAALGVKLGQHWQELPPELVEAADEVQLPLLLIPEDQPYMDIMLPIMEKLLNLQVTQLKRYESIHNRLLQVLLAGGDYRDLCVTLQEIVNNPTLIVDRRGQCLAGTVRDEEAGAGPLQERTRAAWQRLGPLLARLTPNRSHYVELPLADTVQPIGIVPVKFNNRLDGALVVVQDQHPIGEETLRIMEYAGPMVALVFAKENAVAEAQRQLTGDFLEELINNTFNDEELMERRASFLHFSLKEPVAVFVIRLSEQEDFGAVQPEEERQARKEFLWDKVREILSGENSVMLQFKSSALIGLARVKEDRDLRRLQALLTKVVREAQENLGRKAMTVGIGRPYPGARRVSQSYREALTAVKVGEALAKDAAVWYFGDLGPYRFLHELRGSQEMQAFHREVIGVIKSYDREHGTNLLETLACYFAHDGNLQSTAAALYVHKNTVAYRLRKIEEITGLSLRRPNDRFYLELGLRLDKMVDS